MIPWVESPLFPKLLPQMHLSQADERMARQYAEYGFVEVDLRWKSAQVAGVVEDMVRLSSSGDMKTQEAGYHYSDGPRLFEGWKVSKRIAQLALHREVLRILRVLYQRKPIPFQTINFLRPSQQPLHSDVVHFHSIPQRWMAACWVALEDVNAYNGTLQFIPGTHRLPTYDFSDLGIEIPEYGQQFAAYRQYEQFIADLVKCQGYATEHFYAPRGRAIIFAANLIHGGTPRITRNVVTRYSQVTHYFFEGCETYYAPMFSRPFRGEYAVKDLTTKNIKDEW